MNSSFRFFATARSAIFVTSLLLSGLTARGADPEGIAWQPWSAEIFQRAAAEHKLVILDLGAGWCHWCHVMDDITYRDPQVRQLLRENYIAVRMDQDARPDLASRYEDYGWPATIVFKWDGSELAKRRGYLPPQPMIGMLRAFVDDPTPGPSIEAEAPIAAAPDSALTPELRQSARKTFLQAYDAKRGGWGDIHKYLNSDAVEYCLTQGLANDPGMEKMARQTLTSALKLVDPAWGGVYQYSTDGDWDHPHFEKIMPFQSESMRVFSMAAALWREPQWLQPAQQIHSYLRTFLTSPEGAFYTSQDADLKPGEHAGDYFALDDAARRKAGIPRVDRHIYVRENGLAITGLAALYAASGDETCLAEARRAAAWIDAHRVLPGGGFRHDEIDSAGPYLADTLAMARAFLALYTVTAERPWLSRAEAAAAFIDAHFRAPLGFQAAASPAASALPAKPQLDENIALTRLTILLHHHTGNARYREMAGHAMRYVASPSIVDRQGFGTSGILLADQEMRADPTHLTIVGPKDAPAARALFTAGLRSLPPFARLEWFDAREGPLPRAEIPFPALPEPAAFLCRDGACSPPMHTPGEIAKKLARPAR